MSTTRKRGEGNFVKDAMNEQMLEVGFDKIYKLSFTTTEQIEKRATSQQSIADLNKEPQFENRFVKMEVNLGHDSTMKVLKLLNPKRIHWTMGEPPTKEEIEKYGKKARWKWYDYDMNQLRFSTTSPEVKAEKER